MYRISIALVVISILTNILYVSTAYDFQGIFRTQWDTHLFFPLTQIKLPLISSGTYNFTVKWVDGFINNINFLTIIPQVNFWNTSLITSTAYMFAFAYSFNSYIASWNTQSLTNADHMFYYAQSFNQALPWNMGSVISMAGMFSYATVFN